MPFRVAVGCAVVLLSTVYVGSSLNQGWIPHDEGQLGQTAERILAGELPHRDFVEPYTGGLGYLNALAFHVAGISSEVLRWQLLPFFVAFAGCLFFIASRVLSPVIAAAVTVLGTFFTLPIYPAGMPSWYNLFAATYGIAALLRFLDTGRSRWVVLAGVCAGLSILVKITGLYFIAAALLWLVYREQLQCAARDRRSMAFSISASLVLAAFGGLALFFVRRENPLMDVVHFCLPFVGLTALVIHNEWRRGRGDFTWRVARLAKCLVPFCCGVTIPLAVFLIPYVITHSIADLLNGLFVLPARRLAGARMALPDLQWLLVALPLSALFGAGLLSRPLFTSRSSAGASLSLCPSHPSRPLFSQHTVVFFYSALIGLLAVSHTDRGYVGMFQAIRHQLPLLVVIATAMLAGVGGNRLSDVRRQELLLLSAATFFVSLIQFPYSGGFYFFYAAPLGVLLASYVVAFQPHAPRRLHLAVMSFVALFLMLRMHHPSPAITGGPYAPQTQTGSLQLDRCRLTVRSEQARLYNAVIAAVQCHSETGEFIYAGPDCPEVYFLAGRKNPTRSLYELFDVRDPDGYRQLVADLDRLHVKVVVLKRFSEFSAQLDPEFVALLERRFGQRQCFMTDDRSGSREAFVVLWRS